MTPTPTTKAEAIARGEKTYFTGAPCAHGHVAPRRVSGKCVECCRAQSRDYYSKNAKAVIAQKREYQAENRDSILEKRADYRDRNRDRLREECRKYHAENRESRASYSRKWRASLSDGERREHDRRNREKNKEKRAANRKAWGERTGYKWSRVNPEGQAAKNARRRARSLSAEGAYSSEDVKAIRGMQKGRCACCGDKAKLEVDHIVPLNAGGTNWPKNLQLLCKPCNASKSDRDQIEFMQSRGALL